MGSVSEHLNRNHDAESMYKKAIELSDNSRDRAKKYWLLGELYRRNKHYDHAIRIYRLGLKTFPDETSNMFGIWETMIEKGDKVDRLNDCIALARKIAEKTLRARFTLAILYMAAKKQDDATGEFTLFLETIKTNPKEWGMRLKPEKIRAQQYLETLQTRPE